MGSREAAVARLLGGWLDVLLAVTLAVLATLLHWYWGEYLVALIDLTACVAAALTVRWPRAAGAALGVALASLWFTPLEWGSMAEYAPLIPILGTGLRGQRRERLWMTIAYGSILAALTFRDMPDSPMVWFALSVWAALITLLWGIGDLFTNYRKVQDRAHAGALQQQRVELARELHDTVARDLSRASLQAQAVMEERAVPELASVVTGIQQASAQLRWMLALLRDPHPPAAADTLCGSLQEAVSEAEKTLRDRGFKVTASTEGELAEVPQALVSTLRAAIGEACANIERHADPGEPCAIVVSVGQSSIDAVFLNDAREVTPTDSAQGVGLMGLRERLAVVGGELFTEQEGSQWITRITVPL